MAYNLDDIIQRIIMRSEGFEVLNEIKDIGSKAFESVASAAGVGESGLHKFAIGALAIPVALAAITVAASEMVVKIAELTEQQAVVGDAFGASRDAVAGLKESFAGLGISSEKFLRGLEMMSIRSAETWQRVDRDVREGQDIQDRAAQGVESAQERVAEAFRATQFASAEWGSKLEGDALAVAGALNKVMDQADKTTDAFNSVASANLSVQSAEMALRKAKGETISPQEEQAFKIKQAQQQVTEARQRASETATKAERQPLEERTALHELSDAILKQQKDRAAPSPLEGAQTKLQEAMTSLNIAINHLADATENNVKGIADQLRQGELQSGASPQKIFEAIKSIASPDGKTAPTGDQILHTMNQVFVDLGSKLADSVKQAIVRESGLAAPRGTDAAEFARGLSEPGFVETAEGKGLGKGITDTQLHAAESINSASATFGSAVERFERAVGLMAGNVFLEAIKDIANNLGKPESHAEGGLIRGPGTGTSDSILGRLSRGEYIVRADGGNLMDAITHFGVKGFAMGGPVMAPIRVPSAGGARSGSTLNLTIDGNRFEGLHAPTDVASKLTTFAIQRQTAATGRRPSWVS